MNENNARLPEQPLSDTVVNTYTPEEPLIFTASAAAKVYELIMEEGNLDLNLRVSVAGGGCSGFQYAFAFEEEIAEDDTVIAKKVGDEEEDSGTTGSGGKIVRLLVDPMSLQYLMGAEIDYKDDLDGARFVIRNNPNAQTTCGCGSSFAA